MNRPPSQPCVSVRAVDCSQIADWSRAVGWDIEYQQISRGTFDAWFCVASCQELRLTNQWCNREMVICGCPPRDMLAMVLPSGRDHLGVYEGRTLGRYDAVGLFPGDGRVLCSPPGFRTCTVSISRARFEAALWHHARYDLSARLPESQPFALSPKRLHKLAATICSLAGGEPRPVGRAAIVELEDRILQQLALGLCEAQGDLEQPRRRGDRAEYVRRARDYIEAHLEQAMPLSQVAAHAGVSTRTLELSFRNVIGTTPTAYIRTRRLNKARRRLLEEGRMAGTLAELALEHGLFHFGRFSRDYRALFGELPSETRRRSYPVHRSPGKPGAPNRHP
jgi:AraC family ethanolamine operon transcriptional activator